MSAKMIRFFSISSITLLLILGITFLLSALKQNIVFFIEPTEIVLGSSKVSSGERFRLGGLVKEESIKRDGININFVITDTKNEISVKYSGSVPDLFKENQGVIAEGYLKNEVFFADTILAKHDENYMPREVAKSLKSKGVWRGDN